VSVFGGKTCDGCSQRDELIRVLTKQLEDRERTMLALFNPAASRMRYAEPKAQQETAPAVAPVVTPDMQRGMTYTPPPGRDPFEVERDFEVENEVPS
jgi:hypothetical protein